MKLFRREAPVKEDPPLLKRCPFCGGEASYTVNSYGNASIGCGNDGCLVSPGLLSRTFSQGAYYWNNRAGD